MQSSRIKTLLLMLSKVTCATGHCRAATAGMLTETPAERQSHTQFLGSASRSAAVHLLL